MKFPAPIQNLVKNKKALWIGVAVILLVALFLIIRNRQKKKAALAASIVLPETTATKVAAMPTDAFPLKAGSRGRRVEQLQQYLIKKKGAKFPKFGADGIWAQETEANVKGFLNATEVDETLFKELRMSDFAVKAA